MSQFATDFLKRKESLSRGKNDRPISGGNSIQTNISASTLEIKKPQVAAGKKKSKGKAIP